MVLQKPSPSRVTHSEAIQDDALVSGALEMFGGTGIAGRGEGPKDGALSRSSSSSSVNRPSPGSAAAISRVTGVVKSSSDHLVSTSIGLVFEHAIYPCFRSWGKREPPCVALACTVKCFYSLNPRRAKHYADVRLDRVYIVKILLCRTRIEHKIRGVEVEHYATSITLARGVELYSTW